MLILCASTILLQTQIYFFYTFPDFVETTLQFQEDLYIFGDFNIHLDLPSLNITSFMDVLQTYALRQHVSFPIHFHGHWLDLFITRSTCNNIKAIFPTDGLYQIAIVLLLVCGYKSGQDLDFLFTFGPINKIN